MKSFFGSLYLFIVGILVLIFLLSLAFHHFAFKYLFQSLTSFAFIFAGIYYLFKKEIGLGIFLFVMSVVAFYLGELLFSSISPEFSPNYNYRYGSELQYSIWNRFLNVRVYFIDKSVKIWQVLICLLLFLNALVISKKHGNMAAKVIAVNLLAILFTILIFFVYT